MSLFKKIKDPPLREVNGWFFFIKFGGDDLYIKWVVSTKFYQKFNLEVEIWPYKILVDKKKIYHIFITLASLLNFWMKFCWNDLLLNFYRDHLCHFLIKKFMHLLLKINDLYFSKIRTGPYTNFLLYLRDKFL